MTININRNDTLNCSQSNCKLPHKAENMLCRDVLGEALRVTTEAILAAVVCPTCDKMLQKRNIHTVPLGETVRRIKSVQERASDAAKRADEVAGALRAYATKLLDQPLYSTGPKTFVLPTARVVAGKHTCGLPLACCTHAAPVSRFLVLGGTMIGICDFAEANIQRVARNESRHENAYRLYACDLGNALRKVERETQERPFKTARPGLKQLAAIDTKRREEREDEEYFDELRAFADGHSGSTMADFVGPPACNGNPHR